MKTSQSYWNEKNQKCEIWFEEINGKVEYWERINGISFSITERKYKNKIKKHNLKDLTV